jgi:hypothetical protein
VFLSAFLGCIYQLEIFFGYPPERVTYYHERGIPDDNLPVLFFICKYALVEPDIVLDLRKGRGWLMDSNF